VPLIYGVTVVSGVGIYNFWDKNTVDAHLARATQADLLSDRVKAVGEYKQALALEDNAHTHKLLALEFADQGMWTEAISELRLAEAGGESDDSIHYWLAQLMERINHRGEAQLEYEKFLSTEMCTREPVDARCNQSQERLAKIKSAE
jgi:tetratricopeptide (TPR) repeat protein